MKVTQIQKIFKYERVNILYLWIVKRGGLCLPSSVFQSSRNQRLQANDQDRVKWHWYRCIGAQIYRVIFHYVAPLVAVITYITVFVPPNPTNQHYLPHQHGSIGWCLNAEKATTKMKEKKMIINWIMSVYAVGSSIAVFHVKGNRLDLWRLWRGDKGSRFMWYVAKGE